MCLENNCNLPPASKGYCLKHYNYIRYRGGFSEKKCETESCEKTSAIKGLCRPCYDKKRRATQSKEERKRKFHGICMMEGCNKPGYSKKLCQMHYTRLQRTGEVKLIKKPKSRFKQRPRENFAVDFADTLVNDDLSAYTDYVAI
mgnify:CR=1 FL=1